MPEQTRGTARGSGHFMYTRKPELLRSSDRWIRWRAPGDLDFRTRGPSRRGGNTLSATCAVSVARVGRLSCSTVQLATGDEPALGRDGSAGVADAATVG